MTRGDDPGTAPPGARQPAEPPVSGTGRASGPWARPDHPFCGRRGPPPPTGQANFRIRRGFSPWAVGPHPGWYGRASSPPRRLVIEWAARLRRSGTGALQPDGTGEPGGTAGSSSGGRCSQPPMPVTRCAGPQIIAVIDGRRAADEMYWVLGSGRGRMRSSGRPGSGDPVLVIMAGTFLRTRRWPRTASQHSPVPSAWRSAPPGTANTACPSARRRHARATCTARACGSRCRACWPRSMACATSRPTPGVGMTSPAPPARSPSCFHDHGELRTAGVERDRCAALLRRNPSQCPARCFRRLAQHAPGIILSIYRFDISS